MSDEFFVSMCIFLLYERRVERQGGRVRLVANILFEGIILFRILINLSNSIDCTSLAFMDMSIWDCQYLGFDKNFGNVN